MAHTLWLHPVPAQEDAFLQLHYENSYGQPETATSSLYQHPWSQHDNMGLAAEVEIERGPEDGYVVALYVYSWNVWEGHGSPEIFERYQGCQADKWESAEFSNFYDAEAFAQFAWGRWRDRGHPGAAGMTRRDDLDRLFNPIPMVAA